MYSKYRTDSMKRIGQRGNVLKKNDNDEYECIGMTMVECNSRGQSNVVDDPHLYNRVV